MADAFFDSNILLYLISEDVGKAARSEALLLGGGVISVQVLNEFTDVARRKHALEWPEIRAVLAPVRRAVTIASLTVETYERAAMLSGRYSYRFYHALILAAGLLADCTVLYSEDMQHGQVIDGQMTILNPYL